MPILKPKVEAAMTVLNEKIAIAKESVEAGGPAPGTPEGERLRGYLDGLQKATEIVGDVALGQPRKALDTSRMTPVVFELKEVPDGELRGHEVVARYKMGFHSSEVVYDSNPESPRGGYNATFGTMVCLHRRHKLGDEHGFSEDEFNGWDEIRERILEENPGAVVLPLNLYDHSGLSMSVASFHGRAPHASWDSGQVGFIFASGEVIMTENNLTSLDQITEEMRKAAAEILTDEVKTYDDFLRGNVYGHKVYDATGDDVDSCWGYYGLDYVKEQAQDNLKSAFEHSLKDPEQPRLFLDDAPVLGGIKALVLTAKNGADAWIAATDVGADGTHFDLTLSDAKAERVERNEGGFDSVEAALKAGVVWMRELVEEKYGE